VMTTTRQTLKLPRLWFVHPWSYQWRCIVRWRLTLQLTRWMVLCDHADNRTRSVCKWSLLVEESFVHHKWNNSIHKKKRVHNVTFITKIFNSILTISKNIPDVFSYNSRKHCRIIIIFGRSINEKNEQSKDAIFSTSPN